MTPDALTALRSAFLFPSPIFISRSNGALDRRARLDASRRTRFGAFIFTRLLPSLYLMLVVALPVGAANRLGTTGKIAGTVTDARTKEPLIAASVTIEGTRQGARTDINGRYVILNVSPGTYRVKASYIGYQSSSLSNLTVRSDNTTEADFDLAAGEVEGKEIVVRAERPLVVKDQTATVAIVTSEEIKALPLENFDQVIGLQAGIVGGTFRGGRRNEVAYIVDGIAMQDPFEGGGNANNKGGANAIEPQAIQELQVITGAYNAEYGLANSGIVSIVTKDGGDKYSGNILGYTGDYLSTRTGLFQNISNVSPAAVPNIQGSLSGPVPGMGDRLTFYVSGRATRDEGYLFGSRQYQPTDVLLSADPTNPYTNGSDRNTTPRSAIQGFFAPGTPGEPNTATLVDGRGDPIRDSNGEIAYFKTDANGKFIVDRQNGVRRYIPYDPQNAQYLAAFDNYENLGTGDNSAVSLNPFRRYSLQGKLTFRPIDALKLTFNSLYEDEQSRFYDHGWSRNPDGDVTNFRRSTTNYLTGTYTASAKTVMTGSVSYFSGNLKTYAFEDPLDSRYQNPALPGAVGAGAVFVPAGTKNNRFERATQTLGIRADASTQFDNINLFKAGFELRQHRINYETIDIRAKQVNGQVLYPFQPEIPDASGFGRDFYTRSPTEFSAYIQDKIELKNFIVNLGVRLDYFNPQTRKPRDTQDPSEFLPLTTDSIYALRNGTTDRFVDVQPKISVSPRLAIAFPITEKSIVHFSYGQFFQIPNFELLYRNSSYKFSQTDAAVGIVAPFGNPDLRPQRTSNAEIGYKQEFAGAFAVDFTVYLRDIRDLAGSARVLRFNTGTEYLLLDNSDYGYVRGFIISVDKRISQTFSLGLDYTFQLAEGNASDPQAAANALLNNAEPETRLISLDWDQRHTLNGSLTYSDGNGWNFGLIARYGSGFPYTPIVLPAPFGGITNLLTNSQLRPPSVTVDVRATRDFRLGDLSVSAFVQVFNLLDAGNPNGVFGETGRADVAFITEQQRLNLQTLNDLDPFYVRPDFYSPPRRISIGASLNF